MTSTKKTRTPPIGVRLGTSVEEATGRRQPFRARVYWQDPVKKRRDSISRSHISSEAAWEWVKDMKRAAGGGVDPDVVNMDLATYGNLNMKLALRGLEPKTSDPYLAGWRKRVVPTLGHLPVGTITYGAVDRAVHGWISDGLSISVIKNSIAVLVRVMEQAFRDELVERNPARLSGWQRQYHRAEDELDDPRALALPSWAVLMRLASALVEESHGRYRGWGDVVMFAGATGARIGEISGCRVKDIDRTQWIWKVRRQTTPSPGGLLDKATKGKRARDVPLISEIRELVERRIALSDGTEDARLFCGPRGGRVSTAVFRDATSWDTVVERLGFEHLRRHDLRHTALTWFADSGVPVHHLQKIAGHGSLTTTQRYLHPSKQSVADAGELLSQFIQAQQPPAHPIPKLRLVTSEPVATASDFDGVRPGARARAIAESHLRRTGQLPNVPALMELAEVSRGTAWSAIQVLRDRAAG
ncbi:tyrosine-type recombinase/integrase [Amycolatopsis sp. H20-H5]|uniref:tyrosine-type recombinase/integrase n=1 Tax=Amycolatopsis sp. H20-H5 TaxID=3046309 RepID=UPI002DB6D05E|nr:site-specific integrase [Amycolatopsis sp. H20-H5]MEC3976258.1 site-specific integrase [Amycolatopsis sp. H20-H5]